MLVEVPGNPASNAIKRSSVVTVFSNSQGSGSKQMFALSNGNVLQGSSQSLTNASLVELGKQLLVAARDGNNAEVGRLLGKGAPMTTDWLGTSPLHLTAQYGHADTADILLKTGCQRDARTKVEKTPLHIAATEGHDNVAELLLASGAEVDSLDMLKMTPLHWSVDRCHINLVETLLKYGADPYVESKFGKSPMEIAASNGRHDIVEILENAENYRVAHASQSEAMTLAATQSIMTEEYVDLQDTVQPIVEEEALPSLEDGRDDSKEEARKLLAAHGITLIPEDKSSLDVTGLVADPARKFALTEAGRLALGLTTTKSGGVLNLTSQGQVKKPSIARIVRVSTNGGISTGNKSQNSTSTPKVIQITPAQFAAIKASNATKITIPTMQTVSAFKKKIVTRIPGGEVSTPLDQRGALKIVKVNPSISIQPKKQGSTGAPVVITPMLSLKPTVTPTIKPVVSSQAKTVVVTSSSEVLRKQLEECQRALERMTQELKQRDEEIERLKKLNEDKSKQS